MPRPPLKACFFIFLLLAATAVRAEKTDTVFLNNGDRVTGEVKGLFRGKLEFKTDHMGTVYIEWEDIAEIISTTGQSVELTNGQRFFGALSKPGDSEMLIVNTAEGAVGVGTLDVVGMYPVEVGFWERLDVNASLGFSWDKGSAVGKYNIGLDAEYRDPRFITRASFSSEVTTQEDRDDTTRASLNFSHVKFLRNKRYTDAFANVTSNDELGIDARALVGFGYGWAPIRSNRNWFMMGGGLSVNHEIPLEGDDETNLEAVGMINYEYFKYSNPERKLTSQLIVFPSITDFGRWRADFVTDFRLEFVDDLFWVMEVYANYDSDPVSDKGSSSDYGVVSSLAYKF